MKTPFLTTAALSLMIVPAFAQSTALIDYGDERLLDFADRAQWTPIAEKIGGDVEVFGEVSGSFTAPGADEVAYLVSDAAPIAADPFPEVTQRIAVFANGEQVADWPLPEASAYTRPVIATDLDGDGISELVMEGVFYNMGTSATGLDVVKVGEMPEVIQTLPEVYVDSCDAEIGEKGISAAQIGVEGGQLVAVVTERPCEPR